MGSSYVTVQVCGWLAESETLPLVWVQLLPGLPVHAPDQAVPSPAALVGVATQLMPPVGDVPPIQLLLSKLIFVG